MTVDIDIESDIEIDIEAYEDSCTLSARPSMRTRRGVFDMYYCAWGGVHCDCVVTIQHSSRFFSFLWSESDPGWSTKKLYVTTTLHSRANSYYPMHACIHASHSPVALWLLLVPLLAPLLAPLLPLLAFLLRFFLLRWEHQHQHTPFFVREGTIVGTRKERNTT